MKTIFVAGGSSGINLDIARKFASEGNRVAIISRNADRVAAAVQAIREVGGDAVGWSVDVRDYEAVNAAFQRTSERWGEIDVVISGAAGNFIAPALALSSNAFRTIVDIDLFGTFHVFRACFDHVRKPGASLIAISAPQGTRPSLFQAHACAAKAGVNMVVKCLAMEWGPAGIRVNGISPGPIMETVGMEKLEQGRGDEIDAMLPLRRHGLKHEISEAAVFLSSEAAAYITGVILDVDGGLMLGPADGDAINQESRS